MIYPEEDQANSGDKLFKLAHEKKFFEKTKVHIKNLIQKQNFFNFKCVIYSFLRGFQDAAANIHLQI